MERTLKDFPEAFVPLVVVVGDRREARPKTRGDLLAYSVSTVDVLYLNRLKLPQDTLILSDKIFVLERQEFLREEFGRRNILTIGSPAVNLFSRMINDRSIFRFQIDEEAKTQMSRQEEIVERIKRDRFGLGLYKIIVEEGAQSPDDIAKAFRGKITLDENVIKRFESISAEIQKSGLLSYRELLRNFEGKGILDPIVGGKLNRDAPKLRGAFLHEYNDFGFVSFAKHPFAETDNWVVIYAAGRHGPATSHSIDWLARKDVWERHPYGGVFEAHIDTSESFSSRFQNVTPAWDTDDYSVREVYSDVKEILGGKKTKVFLSAPLRRNREGSEKNVRWLARMVEEHYRKQGRIATCEHPYSLVFEGEWNYVNGILKHFPESRYIVHDITGYSPGVIFEVGCSIGLNKKFVLIWNISEQQLTTEQIPRLLKRTDIAQIPFAEEEQAQDMLEKIFNSIDSAKVTQQCPGSPLRKSDQCPHRFEPDSVKPESGKVFIVVNDKWRQLKSSVIKRVRDHGYTALLPKDFSQEVAICQICSGIASCGIVVVDVTEGDMDGLLTLGMARARERRTLELFREDSHGSSMFDGQSQKWREETIDDDLDNALVQFLPRNGQHG